MLTTLANIKSYLGISPSDTAYDAFLTQQGEVISDAIEGYCGRVFAQTTYTQTYYLEDFKNNPRINELILHCFPLVSVTSVKEFENEDAVTANIFTTITDFRYHLPTATLTKNSSGNFFCNGDIVKVLYSSGYATTPSVVLNALYGLLQERYNKKVNGIDLNFGSDVQSINIPGTITIQYDFSLNNNERKNAFGAILGNYANTLDKYRSEKTLVGSVRKEYVS